MGTVKVTNIEPIADNGTLTIGNSGDTIALTSGAKTSGFGKIGQVIQTHSSTETVVTTTAYTDLTNCSVNITPTSTSSKILVQWSGEAYVRQLNSNKNPKAYGVRLMRDSTAVWSPIHDGNGSYMVGLQIENHDQYTSYSNVYLDSPASTAQLTYKLQGGVYSTDAEVHFNNGAGAGNVTDGSTQIIVMEILD